MDFGWLRTRRLGVADVAKLFGSLPSMNVGPLHDRIIVQRLEEGEQHIGGIIIGKTQNKKH
jgi:hypothetical protein